MNSFWVEFQNWYSNHTRKKKKKLQLSNLDILYGTLFSSRYYLALNHFIIIGKHCLYVRANAKTKFQFCEFISVVHDKLTVEKYIATKVGKRDCFFSKTGPSYKVTSRLLLLSLLLLLLLLLLLFFIYIFYTIKTTQMTLLCTLYKYPKLPISVL